MHFRGPLVLKQFAVYTPSASPSKTESKLKRSAHFRHQQFHENKRRAHERAARADEKRQVGATVTATINGKEVTWVNEYEGSGRADMSVPAAPSPAAPATSSAGSSTVASTSAAASSSAESSSQVMAEGFIASSLAQAASTQASKAASTKASKPKSTSASASTSASSSTSTPSSGDWSQIGYYNADSGVADGLVFLNNMGGQGSGVFDK